MKQGISFGLLVIGVSMAFGVRHRPQVAVGTDRHAGGRQDGAGAAGCQQRRGGAGGGGLGQPG